MIEDTHADTPGGDLPSAIGATRVGLIDRVAEVLDRRHLVDRGSEIDELDLDWGQAVHLASLVVDELFGGATATPGQGPLEDEGQPPATNTSSRNESTSDMDAGALTEHDRLVAARAWAQGHRAGRADRNSDVHAAYLPESYELETPNPYERRAV